MFNIGIAELILILLVAFLVVGPKDLPKVVRALGRAVRFGRDVFEQFKEETGLGETIDELKETERDLKKTIKEADPTHELKQVEQDTEKALDSGKKDW